jgi:hypothetical protein
MSVMLLVSQNLISPYVVVAAEGSETQAVHAVKKLESVSASGVVEGLDEGLADGSMLMDGLIDGIADGVPVGAMLLVGLADGLTEDEDGFADEEDGLADGIVDGAVVGAQAPVPVPSRLPPLPVPANMLVVVAVVTQHKV